MLEDVVVESLNAIEFLREKLWKSLEFRERMLSLFLIKSVSKNVF